MFRINCNGQFITIQAKIGVYVDYEHLNDTAQALTYAAVALQNHSEPTENHVYLYRSAYMEQLLQKQLITNEMEKALHEGQFQVYLQPQYDIQAGMLVAAEALVRWQHPTQGVITPGVFIPTLEASRFISQLDIYVFEEVCKLLANWRQQGKWLPVSVNLSKIDLQNPGFLSKMRTLVSTYGLSTADFHLEVTESVYAENHEKMYAVVEGLRQAGFIIEMDDFGSGYSSLNMLKDIPVDVLKLDMKFFSDERNMNKGGSIVAAIVEMAHTLGIVVVMEGVETKREEHFLQSVHCMIAQGYLYGRPMPVAQFEKLLAESTLGTKMYVPRRDDNQMTDNLYWGLEQLFILLRHSGMILFEYDPDSDYAVFTSSRQKEDNVTTVARPHYLQNLSQQQLHPIIIPSCRKCCAV